MNCPPNHYIENGKCVRQCMEESWKYDNMYCCPKGYFYDYTVEKCMKLICPPGFFAIAPFRCVGRCLPSLFVQEEKCVKKCSKGYTPYGIVCCKNGYYLNKETSECEPEIFECPPGQVPKGDRCVSKCKPPHIFIEEGDCVRECSQGYYAHNSIFCCKFGMVEKDGKCIDFNCPPGYKEVGPGACTPKCPPPHSFIQDDKCVDRCSSSYKLFKDIFCCPKNSFFDEEQEKCIQCPIGSVQSGNGCVSQCPPPKTFIQNGECVNKCSKGYFVHQNIFCCMKGEILDQNTGKCIEFKCPPGSIEIGPGSCKKKCPPPNIFIENDKCVPNCQQGSNVFNDIFCCPKNSYYEDELEKCIQCPIGTKQSGNDCISICPPRYPFIQQGECVNRCSRGYEIHKDIFCCKKGQILDQEGKCIDFMCPIGSIQTGPGQCVSKCPPPNTFIQNGKCVRRCRSGYKIFKNIFCCPKNSYLDEETGDCKQCPIGSVQSGNGCVSQCPPPNIFIQNGQCVRKCSNGYFKHRNIFCCKKGEILDDNGKCIEFNCPPGQKEIGPGQCAPRCPPPTTYIQGDKCVRQCSQGYHRDRFNFCCMDGYVLDSELEECVRCPLGSQQVGDDCIDICTPPLVIQGGECVQKCSKGYELLENTICCMKNSFLSPEGECIECGRGAIASGQGCVSQCPPPNIFIQNGKCVNKCMQGYEILENIFCCEPNSFLDDDGNCIPKKTDKKIPFKKINEETQKCSDNLEFLMDDQGNTLMNNTCTPFIQNGDQRFNFQVFFQDPYNFDESCFELQVFFEDFELPQGNSELNEWTYDPQTQTIEWNINKYDFDDIYQCTYVEEEDQYSWVCEYKVNIIFMGHIQLTYSAKLMVTLDRLYAYSVVVNVEKNNVIGFCCENELNIQTELRFCTTFECTDYIDGVITVIRKEFFFIEQRITTPGFTNFFLKHLQVKLGEFFPDVVQIDNTEPGSIKYKLRSNIAKPGLVIEVISLIAKSPSRRTLQEQDGEIRDDYKLSSISEINIVTSENQIQNAKQRKYMTDENDTDPEVYIITFSIIGIVLIAIFTCVLVYLIMMKKKAQKDKQQQYEVNSNNNNNENNKILN